MIAFRSRRFAWTSILTGAALAFPAVSALEACTTDDATPPTTTMQDATIDSEEPDSAVPDAASSGCPASITLTAADLETRGWKKAVANPGACTDDEVTTLEANAPKPWKDLGQGVSAACAACAISTDTSPSWQPVVTKADGVTGFINFGACFGHLEGEACGKAIQFSEFCRDEACGKCAPKGDARAKCVAKAEAAGGACAPFAAERIAACPGFKDSLRSCDIVYTAVRTLCVAPTDGGSDASND